MMKKASESVANADRAAANAGDVDETVDKKVEDLVAGDRVDLQSCPHLHTHPSAPHEFAEVVSVERETDNCVAVEYEALDVVGYAIGQVLKVRAGSIANETDLGGQLQNPDEEPELLTLMHELAPEQYATVVAGLLFYQSQGMAEPANRTDWLHDAATAGHAVVSLDNGGIDNLLLHLQTNGVERTSLAGQKRGSAVKENAESVSRPAFVEAARLFMTELQDSVETLTGIGEQFGSRTLVDVMLLQNAILNGTVIDHYPTDSSVSEVVKPLPSAERWMKYICVQENS